MANRRDFLKTGATAALGLGALGLAAGQLSGCAIDEGAPVGTGSEAILDEGRLALLASDDELRQAWLVELNAMAQELMSNDEMRELFLTRTNAVQLLQAYNMHLDVLEPLLGEVDSSKPEGRLFKMTAAAELFENVPGFDIAGDPLEYENQCANFMVGCCVVHFWNNSCQRC